MSRHIARRIILLIPTLLGLSLLTFVLLRAIPGDPAQIMLGEHATAGEIAAFRQRSGLDRPLPVQYGHYLSRLLRGDWGRSIKTNLPVTAEIARRLPATIELTLAAMAIACAVGIPLGVLAARHPHSPLDWLATGGSLFGASIPLFWLGLLLSYLFAYRLGWLPPSGRLTTGSGMEAAPALAHFYLLGALVTFNGPVLTDALRHLILPALTLSVAPLAIIVRMTRACLLNVLAQDYVRTAYAKGLRDHAVLLRHALRSALPPILTILTLQTGVLLSGAILTETVFAWPGVGQFVVDRVMSRDYPAVQGIIIVSAVLIVLLNVATDIGYAYLVPRIRYE